MHYAVVQNQVTAQLPPAKSFAGQAGSENCLRKKILNLPLEWFTQNASSFWAKTRC